MHERGLGEKCQNARDQRSEFRSVQITNKEVVASDPGEIEVEPIHIYAQIWHFLPIGARHDCANRNWASWISSFYEEEGFVLRNKLTGRHDDLLIALGLVRQLFSLWQGNGVATLDEGRSQEPSVRHLFDTEDDGEDIFKEPVPRGSNCLDDAGGGLRLVNGKFTVDITGAVCPQWANETLSRRLTCNRDELDFRNDRTRRSIPGSKDDHDDSSLMRIYWVKFGTNETLYP